MLAGMAVFLAALKASLRKQPESIQMTLYDLIAAMQDEVEPEDDRLIVSAVAELIRAGRLRFLHDIRAQHAEG